MHSLKGSDTAPIGVFDSGVGGLTVLKALQRALPDENFLYLGDTARLPYGTKSPLTVQRYALQAARVLVERGVKALVVACNTASAVALSALREAYAPVPVFGVVMPGADAAVAVSRSGCIGVLATESTVRGGAYQRAILQRRPDAHVLARSAPLLVTLAEEGWSSGPVPSAILGSYLQPWLRPPTAPWALDTLLLGCTHFPLLRDLIEQVTGPGIQIVDSADTTAAALREALQASKAVLQSGSGQGDIQLLATDDRVRFARIGRHFLGRPISPESVEIVDL